MNLSETVACRSIIKPLGNEDMLSILVLASSHPLPRCPLLSTTA